LDGVERELSSADLLICDAERAPQAIAGIMGGSTSEVAPNTTEILLESAYFERMGIARTSKRLKLRSESSARFERGIDPNAVATNAARAMELLVEVADAQVAARARRQRERRVVADALVGLGLSEAVTLPLVAPDDLERSGAPIDGVVRAANPLRAEESVLRTRILAGLLRAVAGNHAQGLF